MSNTNDLKSTNNVINVIVIIDTDRIINDPSKYPVSKDQNRPTPISHQCSYMVAPSQSVVSGEGTGDLNIRANRDDVIRWTGLSESCNSDSSVLIYGLPKSSGDTVFTGLEFVNSGRLAAEPAPTNNTSPFPVTFTEQKHWYAQATISQLGTEQYLVRFALYYRPDGKNQELYGYFHWDPTITVKE
ncbi:hypothetical protein F9U42_03965 [Pectobacterium versatile]|uniref:inclusion body family protein n=1 Tax=Pectobacterium versatile TaxID=2488639 RepID=UPI001B35C857|nr:inclusion body family protein [Pectobacterium versatile]MBQ4766291.1 hypothetical protein [Pectobacterium versatile]